MEGLVKCADLAVAGELLERILAQPPAFLERLALRLLAAMGYGGRESLAEHTGKSGDAGLDGLVRQDALGLELIGVQAKRYDRDATCSVPRFRGSSARCTERRPVAESLSQLGSSVPALVSTRRP
jgi:restriction endonuclease Mrr